MFGRLWPSPLGMIATAATGGIFHLNSVDVSILSVVVGSLTAAMGIVVQYRLRKGDRSREDVIDLQRVIIESLNRELEQEANMHKNGPTA